VLHELGRIVDARLDHFGEFALASVYPQGVFLLSSNLPTMIGPLIPELSDMPQPR